MEIASYIIENNCTVRQAAKQYGISKSTVHKDVAERLPAINSELARQAREILELNKSERHIRGGLATREKYLHLHNAHTYDRSQLQKVLPHHRLHRHGSLR